ncbi:hypothetical protein U9R71_25840 [Bacillus toyonensis]|uniref:hypothetical protein n=1 Tax=Bacillus toyonensis TaxID=155322 RepID=UPI0018D09412|nr:hypothetical protein [Bacillus toyonensis]MBH0361936.1 hypothetical protein [Bacillus toyonensis biovar Thuringiensis]
MTVENTQTNVEVLKGKLMEARSIQGDLTRYMAREFMPKVRESRQNIGWDKTLTAQGKKEKREKHAFQREAALLTYIENEHKSYSEVVGDIVTAAENILLKGADALNEREQALFDMDAKKLQNAVTFAPTAAAKIEALKNYAALGERGQAYAQQVHANFTEMAAAAIQGTTNPTDKVALTKALGLVNTKLEGQTISEEQKEIASLLDTAKRMKNVQFVNTTVLGNALKEVSPNTLRYANDRGTYLNTYNKEYGEYLKAHKFGYLIG